MGGAVALAASTAAWATPDELKPEGSAPTTLQAPLDQVVALRASGDIGKVVVSQPETIQVGTSGPNSLFVIGRERGVTNLLVYDRAGRFSQSIDVQVGYDAQGLRESLAAALPDEPIEVTPLASGLLLDGEVSSAGAADMALRLAQKAAPDAVISRLQVRGNQVSLEVRILEVSSRRLKDIGSELSLTDGRHVDLRAGSSLIGGDAPEGVATLHLTPGRYRLDARLEALETRGDLQIMARPTLTAQSGASARFRAGGEFPYPVPTGDGASSLEFKTYGTALAFQPQILPNGLIRLALDAELSQLDPGAGLRVDGFLVPGLLVRRATTTVDLRDGEDYLIAGLFHEGRQDAARGVPILSDLPLLGNLIRAAQGVDERRELAIVVTPRIVRPEARPQTDAPAIAEARTPATVSAPRGPPDAAFPQRLKRALAPPVRWAKRVVAHAIAVFRPVGGRA